MAFLSVAFVWLVLSGLAHGDHDFDRRPYDMDGLASEEDSDTAACWEQCFQVEDNIAERYRVLYSDIYRAGMELRRLRNIYDVEGTAFFIDSTLAKWHNPQINPDVDASDTYEVILGTEVNLAAIMAILIESEDSNPLYMAQFNQDRAWSCLGFQSKMSCDMVDNIYNGMSHFSYVNDADSARGNIEAACSLTGMYMGTDDYSTRNELAVAFLNSNVYHNIDHSHDRRHRHRRRHYEDENGEEHNNGFGEDDNEDWRVYNVESPCQSHYRHRVVVSTHYAQRDNVRSFESADADSIYIFNNEFAKVGTDELLACMTERCCGGGIGAADDAMMCHKTEGHYGETFSGFTNHEALGSLDD